MTWSAYFHIVHCTKWAADPIAPQHAKMRLPVKQQTPRARAPSPSSASLHPGDARPRPSRPPNENGTTREESDVERLCGPGRVDEPVALGCGLGPGQDQGRRHGDS